MTKATKVDKSTGIEFTDIPDAPTETSPVETPPPASGDNIPVTFETFREKAREHGRNRALGDDSIAMLAIDICDGAKLGKIDPRSTKDKVKANLETTTDDIVMLFGDYVTARGLKAIHDRQGNSVKNKEAQLRRFAELGKLTDVNGPAVLADVVARYKSTYESADKNMKDSMNNAFDTYVNAARLQLKTPKAALSDDAIEKCMNKTPKSVTRTLATEWTKLGNAAAALVAGTKVLPDGSKLEDKSEAGQKLALDIAAYAKAMVDELTLAEAETKAAELRAAMLARNGISA